MSDQLLIALISLAGSIISALIGAVATMVVSDRKLGCQGLLLVATLFAFCGLVLSGLIAGIVLRPTFSDTPVISNPRPTSAFVTIGDQQEQEAPQISEAQQRSRISAAIRAASNAEIDAFARLDPTPLYSVYADEALRLVSNNLEAYRANGIAVYNKLEAQEFERFTISADGRSAEVELTETWSGTLYYTASGSCAGVIPSHDVPQTLYLENRSNGWIIVAADFPTQSPEPLPCGA